MSRRAVPPRDEDVISAWLQTGGPAPSSVEPVGTRRSKKSVLFRLVGAGDGGKSVVAKLCRGSHARTEQQVYEDVLPRLQVPLPRYYGSVEVAEGLWLYLDDGGTTPCDRRVPAHRVLAGRWLARLHMAASHISHAGLPDRGPAHYLEHLRVGRRKILDNMENPAFDEGHRAVLGSILVQCDELEVRWGEIEEVCALLPRTLVHGDFRRKNLHVRPGAEGLELFPMDWEMAGWGTPASDLWPSRKEPMVPLSDVDAYCAEVRELWPGLDRAALRRVIALGQVFRNLAGIDWAGADLPNPWPEKPIPRMRVYRDDLDVALRKAGWAA